MVVTRSILGSDCVLLVGLELGRGGIDLKGSGVIRDRNLIELVAVQVDRRRSIGEALEGGGGHRAAGARGRAQLDHAVDLYRRLLSVVIHIVHLDGIHTASGGVGDASALLDNDLVTAGNTFEVGLSVRKCGGNRQDYGIATTNPGLRGVASVTVSGATEKDVAFRHGLRKVEGLQLDIDVLSWRHLDACIRFNLNPDRRARLLGTQGDGRSFVRPPPFPPLVAAATVTMDVATNGPQNTDSLIRL